LNDRVFSALQGTDVNGHVRWIEVTAKGKKVQARAFSCRRKKAGYPLSFWRTQGK
jgi:hypothetical protein